VDENHTHGSVYAERKRYLLHSAQSGEIKTKKEKEWQIQGSCAISPTKFKAFQGLFI